MKTISLPLVVALALAFVPWSSAAAQPGSSPSMARSSHTREPSPYIGPFYPYPQVPLGWRQTSRDWDDGWWFLDFD